MPTHHCRRIVFATLSLEAGHKLAHYEILEPIGKGGMGEVYRARDTKLVRDVAIKVLPEEFAKDKERLARFEREAKLLASLNHPNIASIYGLEESDGVKALVLELVEGPTLAERIAEGPIPIEEALPIARQIAEALEAGHEAGVVHRDLKPANVKVKEDGNVKVLDYGLAKALEGNSPRGTESELSQSPTLTRQGTQIGVILGTAAYMSPEQAKGKRVDKRTDIWAFGAVLYEMLTARRAFPGDDTSEALAAVIRAEPALGALPTSTPPAIRRVLRRCFVKNSTERLADIADARIEIAEASTDDAQAAPVTATWQKPRWLALAGVVIVALGFAIRNPSNVDVLETTVTRYVVTLPDGDILHMSNGGLALSPDGQKLAYVATRNRVKQLFVRQRDRVTAEPVPGTENAASPFFSPDGEWLAFFDGRSLMKVSLTGGAPQKVCDAKLPSGASWGVDDTIVYGTFTGAFSVPASGGAPTRLSSSGRLFPVFLLDGESVLLSDFGSDESGRRPTYVYNLVTGEERYSSMATCLASFPAI